MGRGEDTDKMPSVRRRGAGEAPTSSLASGAAPERKHSLMRLGGRYVYLDANNNTDMNWFIDYVKYQNYKNETTPLVDESVKEMNRFSREGVFTALNKENTTDLLENFSELLQLPLHQVDLTTANHLGQVELTLEENKGDREALLRLAKQPGIIVINESDIDRDALSQQTSAEQDSGNHLDKQGAKIYRDGLRRELIENKHPDTLIFFVTDWQSAADIKENFKRDGSVIQVQTKSPSESSHIINETTRVLAEEDYIRLNINDENGQRISRERFGLHLPTPPVHPDSRCQVIHLHASKEEAGLPLQEIKVRLDQKEEGAFVLISERVLSDEELDLLQREAGPTRRVVVVSHPTDKYGSNVDVDHLSY